MSFADGNSRRLQLVEQILHLPEDRLVELQEFLRTLQGDMGAAHRKANDQPVPKDWPHAPLHRLGEDGTYMITAATHQKQHYFGTPQRLDCLETGLLSVAKEAGWHLEAWAVFSNHYHFVGHAPSNYVQLGDWLKLLHQRTATHINQLDQVAGRQVWFNYWDTELTFEKSCLARLNYVHQNAVKHGLVPVANQYRWCSAAWFERTATSAQVRSIYKFKIDKVNIQDDFDPV
jgi:putative transposase